MGPRLREDDGFYANPLGHVIRAQVVTYTASGVTIRIE
jgi:hypothetical protein